MIYEIYENPTCRLVFFLSIVVCRNRPSLELEVCLSCRSLSYLLCCNANDKGFYFMIDLTAKELQGENKRAN